MKAKEASSRVCAVCGKSFAARELTPLAAIRHVIASEILTEHPELVPASAVCRTDLNLYREKHVHALLEAEKGELTNLEKEVIHSLKSHELLAKDVERELETDWTFGERLADKIAVFGGSWTFLICFGLFLLTWIGSNTLVWVSRPPDPFPFILLNLILSCLAAIQAPIIMMSQNRQEAKDRLRSQHDYQVNLKAELEIRHLHEKMDHLLLHQWERLAEIQQIQLELLSELARKR
ncbi:MAG: DUF1003 domain-containing protein [Polyangiaceae bacterium]|nr:DUF1003 domain-containing protein [Polyangiaceae bacterium]